MTAAVFSRPSQLSERVSSAIEQWIAAGRLAPGARLPTEKALTEQFGVSRTVVREAISRLKAEGYVLTRQGAGAFVAARPGLASFRVDAVSGAPERERMAEVFELRYIVETAAAALAARRRQPADLDALRAAATGNALLQRFIRFMGHQFFDSRAPTWSAAGHVSGRAEAAQEEHRALLAAIEAGDAFAARAAARRHLIEAAHRLGVRTAEWDEAPSLASLGKEFH